MSLNFLWPQAPTDPAFRGVPVSVRNDHYTISQDDNGKKLLHTSATAHTYTFRGVYSPDFTVTIINATGAGVITIAADSMYTIYLSGAAATTGSRTLTAVGVATATITNVAGVNTIFTVGSNLT